MSSSKLQGTSLKINDTKEIAKIKTSVNNVENEVPTSKAVKDLIDSLVPETLEVGGEWANKQIRGRIPDPEGLTFTVTYKDGNIASDVGARLVSPETWPDVGSQTATFSYTENGITIYGTREIGIELIPVLLTIIGDWTNYQYAGEKPNQNGLTFTVTYDDGSTIEGLTNLPVTPEIWGNTVGEQIATFSYSQETSSGTATVTTTKTANVVRKPESLVVTGDWGNQYKNCSPDLTGLNFGVNYSNGDYKAVEASSLAAVTPNIWEDTGAQTATFYYTENGETVTATKTADVVRKPESLVVTGEMNNASNNIYQYTLTKPNLNGITSLKVYYKGEETPEDIVISDPRLSISPKQWSNLANQQLITFTFTDNEVEVQSVKTANVVRKLTGLSVGGSWSKTQYINTTVHTTGLTFTASYNNGTTATVTAGRYSPITWGSTPGTQTCTFYYSENGIEVSASSSVNVVEPWDGKRVGGIIFYINTSSTNTYIFHNANDEEVSAPSVGTDCSNWTYKVTGSSVDKFYVHQTVLNPRTFYWGYYKITTGATGNSIGAGKTNTSKVMAITDTSSYASGSIWEYIKMLNIKGDGWYVGCPAEYDLLRASGTIGASWFSSEDIWSSSERTSYFAYYWVSPSVSNWSDFSKATQFALVPIRSF